MLSSLSVVEQDDGFFASCLDLVPTRFVVPLTDAEKERLHELSLPKKAGAKKDVLSKVKAAAATPQSSSITGSIPRKSNATRIEEAFNREKEETARVLVKSNIVASEKPKFPFSATTEVATVSELRARLQSRVEENRKRAGVPGARAERDKLLPPKQKKPRVAKEGEEPLPPSDKQEGEEPSSVSSDKQEKPATVRKSAEAVIEAAPVAPKKKAPAPVAVPVAATTTAVAAVAVAPATKKPTIEEQISYGALKMEQQKPKSESTSTSSILNVKKLIKKAQDGQARVEALKEQGKDHIVQEERWDALEKKALGEKVRDDPKLLKKALKSLEKKKEKAGKLRKERKQTEETGKKDRISAREKNIKDRSKLQIQKRSGGRIQAVPASEEKSGRRTMGSSGGSGGKESRGNKDGGKGSSKSRPGFEGRKTPASKKPKTE
ncbi:hypothetical protein BASA81_002128 [Batrachochytrium salamandrivorans]|nr:hypothetical protein BASA81_002128 [Batrachochytrium salamandrivorans]